MKKQQKITEKKGRIFTRVGKAAFGICMMSLLLAPTQGSAFFSSFYDESTLLKATEKNRVENVQKLLKKDVNANDLKEAFHKALKMGNVELVKCFIDYGVDLEARKVGKKTLRPHEISLKSNNNSLEIIKLLIEAGENPNLILCNAAHYQNLEVAEYLLENGCDVEGDFVESSERTPLILAAGNATPEIISFFIEAGADINAVDNSGRTPLTTAVYFRKIANVKELINRGADLEAADKDGVTPLYGACFENDRNILKALIDAGAQVDVVDCYSITPLICAVILKHAGIVNDLIVAGADVHMETTKDFGEMCADGSMNVLIPKGSTALSVAKKCNNMKIVKILEGQ